MRTIIHIGQHKTGTTSIQNFLKEKRDYLLRYGLYVPDSLAGYSHPSHFLLNVFSLRNDRLSPMKELMLRENSRDELEEINSRLVADISKHYAIAEENNCKDIVFSNEGLFLLNSISEYKKLLSFFEKYSSEVVCVCCFREKKSFRISYEKQLEKQRVSRSRNHFSYRYLESGSWLFDYKRKKELLMSVFSDTIFFDYTEEDMILTFMNKINYPDLDFYFSRMNVTGK